MDIEKVDTEPHLLAQSRCNANAALHWSNYQNT